MWLTYPEKVCAPSLMVDEGVYWGVSIRGMAFVVMVLYYLRCSEGVSLVPGPIHVVAGIFPHSCLRRGP